MGVFLKVFSSEGRRSLIRKVVMMKTAALTLLVLIFQAFQDHAMTRLSTTRMSTTMSMPRNFQELLDRDEEIVASDVLMDPLPDKEFNLETSGNTPIEGDIIKEGVNDDLIKNILDEDATVKLLPEEEYNGSEDKLRKEELNRNAIQLDTRKWPKVGSIVRVPFVISASFDNREKH